MTADQLRKSILQQAIQGKLVPQDPNDEPASVLLERIREEKARLVEEKKIKKEKNPSVIFRGEDNSYYEKFTLSGEVKCIAEEIPFEIPNGWEWCRLGDITIVIGGYAFSSEDIKGEIGARVIRISDFNEKGWVNNKVVRYKGKEKLIQYEVKINDLLLAMTGGTVGKSFLVDYLQEKTLLNQRVASIRSINTLPQYLNILLKAPLTLDIINSIKNSTNDNISMKDINNFLCPLPPLAEQLRIVEKIEELIPHIEHYGKAQTELDLLNKNIKEQLKKSVLQYAIEGKLVPQDEAEGTAEVLLEQIQKEKLKLYEENKLKKKDLEHSTIFKDEDNKYYEKIGKNVTCIDEEIPFEIPKNWRWVRVKDIVQVNPKNEAADNTISAFIPMEKIKATFSSVYSYSEKKWGEIKSGFTHFSDGDIAFAKITPCFQNRKSMILQNLPNGIGAGTTELKVLRPCGITMNAYFLLFFLESPYFIEEAKFKGTANQQRILSGYLETKLLALPPLTEQQRIVNTIQNIFRCIEN